MTPRLRFLYDDGADIPGFADDSDFSYAEFSLLIIHPSNMRLLVRKVFVER